jgi:DNA polymerase-3 subunit delta'
MTATELYADVVGQERAVAQLRAAARSPVHAYLLVGPAGSGTREAARSFGASLLCQLGGCGRCEDCRRALAGIHPDVAFHERAGPYITVGDARSIVQAAGTSPVEGRRKVLVLVDFHLVEKAAPALLKAIEEPPPTTVFVVLAEHIPPELVTIASRCVLVELQPVPAERIADALVADGVSPATAAEIAAAAGGNVERARLLASDPGFADRQALWRSVPERLDGTGATASVLADELLASLGGVLEPLRRKHEAEAAEGQERSRLYGESGPSTKQLEERHKREQRRLRLDELRAGLATVAGAYRDKLASGADPKPYLDALDVIAAANEALVRNPNETLLLQAMLVRLDRAGTGARAGR